MTAGHFICNKCRLTPQQRSQPPCLRREGIYGLDVRYLLHGERGADGALAHAAVAGTGGRRGISVGRHRVLVRQWWWFLLLVGVRRHLLLVRRRWRPWQLLELPRWRRWKSLLLIVVVVLTVVVVLVVAVLCGGRCVQSAGKRCVTIGGLGGNRRNIFLNVRLRPQLLPEQVLHDRYGSPPRGRHPTGEEMRFRKGVDSLDPRAMPNTNARVPIRGRFGTSMRGATPCTGT